MVRMTTVEFETEGGQTYPVTLATTFATQADAIEAARRNVRARKADEENLPLTGDEPVAGEPYEWGGTL